MTSNAHARLPRLYTGHDLAAGLSFELTQDQAHYLRAVMRRDEGDGLRLFNGRDGEWLAALEAAGKKAASVRIQEKLKEQPALFRETHLVFAPLKKDALDWLVEKAVELGATHLHPVITERTEARKINEDRLRRQIVEAAEQCERLDLPALQPLMEFKTLLGGWTGFPLLACVERAGAEPLRDAHLEADKIGFLIGPEGGFTDYEKDLIGKSAKAVPVSLGKNILRAETAALFCLGRRLPTE